MVRSLHTAVREVATEVVRELGEGAPAWSVSDVALDPSGLSRPAADQLARMAVDSLYAANDELEQLRGSEAAFIVTLSEAGGEPVTASFPLSVPASWAIAELASQVQDHAVESASSWGAALPPCPEHSKHPLQAHDDGLRAVWRCPLSERVVRVIAEPVA